MKKFTALCFTFILILCLCSCSSNSSSTESTLSNNTDNTETTSSNDNYTKESMLSQAITLDLAEVNTDYDANPARALAKYDGQIIKITGIVSDIQSNHITIGTELEKGLPVNPTDVYLSTDDIVKLDKLMKITIVGRFRLFEPLNIIDMAFIV